MHWAQCQRSTTTSGFAISYRILAAIVVALVASPHCSRASGTCTGLLALVRHFLPASRPLCQIEMRHAEHLVKGDDGQVTPSSSLDQ